MGPAMTWDKQFVKMVNKMKDAIGLLKITTIATSAASMHYDMHLTKKVHYGGVIFHIDDSQERMLKSIFESVILNKMGLSIKFPRKVLHARKSALGVGLMAPKTIMSVLAIKLCVSHQRGETRVSEMININEDNIGIFYGFKQKVIDLPLDWNRSVKTWSDEIRLMLRSRQIEITNQLNETRAITMDKSIMDYAVECADQMTIIE